MPGLGYLRDEDRDELEPEPPMQPFAVDLDSTARPARPLWSWLALVVAAVAVLIAARPPASSFPAEVALRRRKRPPQALLQRELRAFAAAPRQTLLDKATVSEWREWPEEPGLWARDLLLVSTGCTPKACFVGAVHGPGMEGGDLAIPQVSNDETLRRKGILQDPQVIPANAMGVHPGLIGTEVAARGGEQDRIGLQAPQMEAAAAKKRERTPPEHIILEAMEDDISFKSRKELKPDKEEDETPSKSVN